MCVYVELDDVIGCDWKLWFEDWGCFFYLESIVVEVLCIVIIIFLLIFYKLIWKSFLGGYDIFKDIMMMINLWVIYYDLKEWEDLDVFKFEWFFDVEGNFLVLGFNGYWSYLFFSVGRRVCLGELLVKIELFLVMFRFLY